MMEKLQNEKEQRPRNTRRNILKVGGVSLASIVGVTSLGATSALADDGPDTDFNPDNRDEVVGFLNDIDELSEKEQETYAEWLSTEQKEAIGDLYANAELEYNTYEKDVLQTFSSYATATEVAEVEGTVSGFGTVYVHKQILTWDYNGDDYKNVSQELDYELPGPFATFQGKTEDEIDESSTSFTATLSAEYAAEVLGFTRGGEATIVSKGEEDGDHEVLSKSAETS